LPSLSFAFGFHWAQVYSRVPNPGPEFIAEKKALLAELGHPPDGIKDTPQVGWEWGGGAHAC